MIRTFAVNASDIDDVGELNPDLDDSEGLNTGMDGGVGLHQDKHTGTPKTSEQVRYLSDRYDSLVSKVRWLGGGWY